MIDIHDVESATAASSLSGPLAARALEMGHSSAVVWSSRRVVVGSFGNEKGGHWPPVRKSLCYIERMARPKRFELLAF